MGQILNTEFNYTGGTYFGKTYAALKAPTINVEEFQNIINGPKKLKSANLLHTINIIYDAHTFYLYDEKDRNDFNKCLFKFIQKGDYCASRNLILSNEIFIDQIVSNSPYSSLIKIDKNVFDKKAITNNIVKEIKKLERIDYEICNRESTEIAGQEDEIIQLMTRFSQSRKNIISYIYLLFPNLFETIRIFCLKGGKFGIRMMGCLESIKEIKIINTLKHIEAKIWRKELADLVTTIIKKNGLKFDKDDKLTLITMGRTLFCDGVDVSCYNANSISILLCMYIQIFSHMSDVNVDTAIAGIIEKILKIYNSDNLHKKSICAWLLDGRVTRDTIELWNNIYEKIGQDVYDETLFIAKAKKHLEIVIKNDNTFSCKFIRNNFCYWFLCNMRNNDTLETDGVIEILDAYLKEIFKGTNNFIVEYLVEHFRCINKERYVTMCLSHTFKIGKFRLRMTINELPRIFITKTGTKILSKAIDYYGPDVVSPESTKYFEGVLKELKREGLESLEQIIKNKDMLECENVRNQLSC